MSPENDNKPLQNMIRVVNHEGVPSSDGSGRLEIYRDGWGSICPKYD